jgi:glutamine synthetase
MKPKDVIAFAKENGVQVRRPEVHRPAGHLAAHDDPGVSASTRSSSRRASASTARRSAGGSRSTRATCSDDARRRRRRSSTRSRRSPTLSMICKISDPITGQPYGRDPRYIAQKAENVRQARRASPTPSSSAPRPSSSSSTRSATTTRPRGLLRDRLRRGRVEHRAQRGPEPRPQDPPQGGLLPRPADDTLADLRTEMMTMLMERASRSRSATTRSPPPASARSA